MIHGAVQACIRDITIIQLHQFRKRRVMARATVMRMAQVPVSTGTTSGLRAYSPRIARVSASPPGRGVSKRQRHRDQHQQTTGTATKTTRPSATRHPLLGPASAADSRTGRPPSLRTQAEVPEPSEEAHTHSPARRSTSRSHCSRRRKACSCSSTTITRSAVRGGGARWSDGIAISCGCWIVCIGSIRLGACRCCRRRGLVVSFFFSDVFSLS
jgi:hypothetical protein